MPMSDLAFEKTLRADAAFWGRVYQTTSDPAKEADFCGDIRRYIETEGAAKIKDAIDKARPAFAGDMGTDPDTLCRVLLYVALHESEGGKYDRQVGGGPACGWWQVEPASAQSIAVNSGGMWGPKARAITRTTLPQLRAMPTAGLRQFLLDPVNCCVMAAFIALTNAKGKGQLEYLRR